jgi:undecaprenyl-diphosphatase
LVALAMAVVLSLSRVAVGTHYPGDVLAGALLGAAAALVFWQPSIRQLLREASDRLGLLYDRLAASAVRRWRGSAA